MADPWGPGGHARRPLEFFHCSRICFNLSSRRVGSGLGLDSALLRNASICDPSMRIVRRSGNSQRKCPPGLHRDGGTASFPAHQCFVKSVHHAQERGVDAVTVATLMGHRDTTVISRHYAHLMHCRDHLREASGEPQVPESRGRAGRSWRRGGLRLRLPQELGEMLLRDPDDAAAVADAVVPQLPRGDQAVDRRHQE
jgi:hypothetical protein